MKICLFGHGKMGGVIETIALRQGDAFTSLQACDLVIDFSAAQVVLKHVGEACMHQKSILIGTTGWEDDLHKAKEMVENSGVAGLYAPNFALGVYHFKRIIKLSQEILSNYEAAGVEYHHSQKKDVPSGTAKELSTRLGLPTFSSVRCGTIVGKHEVIFDSPSDTLTISHEVKNRDAFARGALEVGKWLLTQKGWRTLDDYFGSIHINHYPLHSAANAR